MISNLETLNAPEWFIIIVLLLLVAEGFIKIGSFLWGWFASKFLKIQTSLSRKKALDDMLIVYQEDLNKIKADQVKDREASKQADVELRESLDETNRKLDEINSLVVSLHIDNLRVQIMDFASACRVRNYTREQYHEIFQLCEKYKVLINRYHIENGVFVVSLEIIKDRYKELDEKHGFLEDITDCPH